MESDQHWTKDSKGPDAAERTRIQFLDNEIDLSDTFLNVVVVDADDPKAVATGTAKALQGYETALAWIDSVRDARERGRLTVKLARLKDRLDGIGE